MSLENIIKAKKFRRTTDVEILIVVGLVGILFSFFQIIYKYSLIGSQIFADEFTSILLFVLIIIGLFQLIGFYWLWSMKRSGLITVILSELVGFSLAIVTLNIFSGFITFSILAYLYNKMYMFTR